MVMSRSDAATFSAKLAGVRKPSPDQAFTGVSPFADGHRDRRPLGTWVAVRDATTAGDSAQDVAVHGHRDDDLSVFRQQMPTGNRIGSSAPHRLHEAGVILVAFLERAARIAAG